VEQKKHRGWLDVDITGRTRGEWMAQFPGQPIDTLLRLTHGHGFARPSEPAVVSKLETLIGALARQASAAGIALVDWKPAGTGQRFASYAGFPALGYAMPERITAVRKTGSDPIDYVPYLLAASETFATRIFGALGIAASDLLAAQGFNRTTPLPKMADPWTDLTAGLLARAKAARPDWASWISESRTPYGAFPPSPAAPLSAADHTLTVSSYMWGDMPGYLLTIWPRSIESPETLARWGCHAITNALSVERGAEVRQRKEMVLDFRAAPEEIRPALRLIKRAKDGPETVVGSASARGN
jgi:hypothetical protein